MCVFYFRLLIKTYPDLAEVVFNNCITKESVPDPFDPLALPSKHLLMNYEFIDDAFYLESPEKEGNSHFLAYFKKLVELHFSRVYHFQKLTIPLVSEIEEVSRVG